VTTVRIATLWIGLLVFTTGATAEPAVGFPLTLRDAEGATLALNRPPTRIVSLAPSVTETLFALGLDREIAGISDADDYPPDRVRGRPRVGGVVPNVERIVALRADLVIGIPSLQRDALARLRALGLPVFAVDAATLDETLALIRTLGRLTGRDAQADRLLASLAARVREVRPGPPVRVYIEAWSEPLLAAAGATLVDDLARRAGGRNIFADLRGYTPVSAEAVLVRDPHVILLMYPGRSGVLARPGWRATAAGRAGRVHELPTALVSRPGPRIAEGLTALARYLYDAR
jgi:iron complex transport system substrate-binding protein